ncbi:hypothetical protein SCA6_002637 [Theobroma cacao]
MGNFTVLGLVLAVLCVITGECICTGDSHSANCSKPDLEALFDFESGLNDPENRLSSWQGSNYYQWNGIGRNNSTGAVIMIDLQNPYPINSESSSSSDSLEWVAGPVSLKHLAMTEVDLSIVGSGLVGMLSRLSFLNELHLSECQISGSISSFNPVNLTSLSVLDLSFNSFSSGFPDWVVNISSLTYVDSSYCGLAGRIPLGFGFEIFGTKRLFRGTELPFPFALAVMLPF